MNRAASEVSTAARRGQLSRVSALNVQDFLRVASASWEVDQAASIDVRSHGSRWPSDGIGVEDICSIPMTSSSSLLFDYLISILPPGLLALTLLLAIPRTLVAARLGVHILFFIFARDAMSPAGFWQLGPGSMRLAAPTPVLFALAGMSAVLFTSVAWLERLTWWRGVRPAASVLYGVLGALVITGVAAALKTALGLPSLPKPGPALLGPILVFALLGNAYEELLFRGMLQQRLRQHMTPMRAVVVAAVLFSLCHVWLAVIVTHVGLPVLVFTLIEGLVAGLVYQRAGLPAAALTHGLAIAALASGLY